MTKLTLATLLSFLAAQAAYGHARITSNGTLLPRNTFANKVGPCGSARGNTVTYLNAGASLTVQWEEFIEHPGYYRIAFSPSGDAGFDQNIIMNNIADRPGATGTNPNLYSQTITVPNTTCNTCTLQVIQYMTENPAMPSLYYSCADIVILPAGATLPTPNPGPAPPGTGGTTGSSGSTGTGGSNCP